MNLIQKSSPNFSPGGNTRDLLVIHRTLGLMPGCLEWLTSSLSQVSCHFLITKSGEVYQLVPSTDTAWHAGNISNPTPRAKTVLQQKPFGGYVNPNKYTIGIEFESMANDKWTEPQMASAKELFKTLPYREILTHQDIADYKENMEDWRLEFLKSPQSPKAEIIKKIKELLDQI